MDMQWFGIILLAVFAVLYYRYTTPEERMKAAERRHQTNQKVLSGGLGLMGSIFKRLR